MTKEARSVNDQRALVIRASSFTGNHGGLFPILSRAINCCWFCFKWGLVLAVVAGIAAIPYFYRRVDEEIRRRVESRIAQHYVGLKVSVGSAQLVEGKGIRVHDLVIVEPGAEGPRAELISLEEVFLECPTDLKDLAAGDPPVRRVMVRRLTLRVTRRADGGWSAAKLLPPPQFGDRPPEVTIENGTIEIFDPLKSPTSTLSLRDVNLTLTPTPEGQAGPSGHARQLQGMFTGDHFRRVEFQGLVDMATPTWSISGNIDGLEFSPELRESLPDPLCSKLLAIGALRGQGDLSFKVGYDPATAPTVQFELAGRLARGRLDDARLPHPLTEIRATVHVNNGGYAIDDLVARSSQATLRMSCRRAGFDAASPLTLTAEVRQLELDRPLLDILPEPLKDHWYKYRPAGEIDADVRLGYDGRTWQPEVSVRCQKVSFTHHKFPYRLEHGKGTLDLKDDLLKLNLSAYSGSQPVRLAAEVAHPFSGPVGWFEAKGDEIPLDEALLAALPEKPREVVRTLDPRGTVSFYARLWRDQPDGPLHEHLQVAPNRCSIRYQKFPYPLTNIRGMLEMFDGNWTFRNLEGNNDAAKVTCEGHLTPNDQGHELVLNIEGKDVPLSEDLRDALSPHIQQVWRDLRPRGTVDLAAEVRYLPEQKHFSVGVRAQPQRESASIEPVRFPYRLDKLQGVLLYRDGHVTLEHVKAEHGPVKISTEGYCDFQPDGRWKMHFAGLSVDRLRADRELIQALPERLKKAVVELNPTAPVNLRGSFSLERVGRPGEPLRSQWDVQIGLQQASLQCGGLLLSNIHGAATLTGGFDGQHVQSRGELAIDSLNYKDYQLTHVMGPIWIDDGRILLGAWVDRRTGEAASDAAAGPPRPPRPLTANLFGGTLYGDGWVAFGAEPRYAMNVTLTNADLARCAQEAMTGRQKLRGKILATADLSGAGRTRNALSGRGAIRLSNADVYELPVMISLLKILSIRPPDQNAFSAATIDYRIEGEHIYFDRIDFNGDAISLRGKGEMDFQSAIKLTFHAIVGRGELNLPIIKQVFSGASQQIMLIHVDGTLQNPETRKEAFPGVNQALQQLQGELQK